MLAKTSKKLYDELNFVVVERMGKVQMRPVSSAIAPECRERLFPSSVTAVTSEIEFNALSLYGCGGMGSIYSKWTQSQIAIFQP